MDPIDRAAELMDAGELFCLASVISSSDSKAPAGSKAIFFPDGRSEEFGLSGRKKALGPAASGALDRRRPEIVKLPDGLEVFLDVYEPEARLLICGAGHIALPLADFASKAGFSVTVLDDRPDYAQASRFPGCEVIAEDFVSGLRRLGSRTFRFVTVITRGHTHDFECLKEVLPWEMDYLGMIGSRRRVKVVKTDLEREGHDAAMLEKRLFSPIGLAIGAESPEEIALSILAEMVSVRRIGPEKTRALRAGWGKP